MLNQQVAQLSAHMFDDLLLSSVAELIQVLLLIQELAKEEASQLILNRKCSQVFDLLISEVIAGETIVQDAFLDIQMEYGFDSIFQDTINQQLNSIVVECGTEMELKMVTHRRHKTKRFDVTSNMREIMSHILVQEMASKQSLVGSFACTQTILSMMGESLVSHLAAQNK